VLWNGSPTGGPWALRPFLVGERAGVYGPAIPLVGWASHTTSGMCWHRTTFPRPAGDTPLALDLRSMGKGLAWLNGRSIGRYWLIVGDQPHDPWMKQIVDAIGAGEPTQRYYHLPQEWLQDENKLVLFEEQGGDPARIQLCHWS
jgi:hypothetical protein